MATVYEIREGLGGRWNVFKNDKQEPYFDDNKDAAVGSAIQHAQREGGSAVIEVIFSDGTRQREWP